MKIRIVKSAGAFPDAFGRLIAPRIGAEVEVEGKQGKALCDAGLAEKQAEGMTKARTSQAGRAKKPKQNTVGKSPDETR